MVDEYKPDVLILATGGVPLVPGRIPGLREAGCLTNQDVLMGKVAPGPKVLMLGGGLHGAETADFMGEHGYDVTVIEMRDTIAVQDHPAVQKLLVERLIYHGAELITSATVKKVYPDGVDFEKDGEMHHIGGFDSIILAFGFGSSNPLEEQMKDFGGKLIVLGDAEKASNGLNAIYNGTVTGLAI
jgi:pyruvate/2-oxoglutarate dehydrogenase complex dihydrolipoamide dehydrogenase (E3) component